jgi:hypothetical protein
MTMINTDKLRTPQSIFIIYSLAAFLLIMILRFIFPGSPAPLLLYSRSWRLVQGLLEIINFFPAVAFSALVLPFGIASIEGYYQNFSEMFFKHLVSSVVTAIVAAVIYGLIFFLILPLAKNYEENLIYSGDMYKLAKKSAFECRDSGDWEKAYRFLEICDHVWYNSPELKTLKEEVTIKLPEYVSEKSEKVTRARAAMAADYHFSDIVPLNEDQKPVDAAQAITMSREAFNERRYYDAHWLANLGTRLAARGSVEAANAARLASEAWNMIASLAPNAREERLFELYKLKLSGYQAMASGEWISAFYIFQDLLKYTPDDLDAKNFIAVSEKNAKAIAFFIEEMEFSLGENLNGAVFSIPGTDGRAVMRFNSLTTTDDVAYGAGFEYMEFDANMTPKTSVVSQYAKLTPFKLDGKPQVYVLTHALDRFDKNNDFKGEWLIGAPVTGGIFLNISYEDLLVITDVRRGLANLNINELFTATKKLGDYGYISQIFQAEILNKL